MQDGKLRKHLLRSSLSRLEEQISQAGTIRRCHRSYIVNLAQVSSISGNAQGYHLHFRDCDEEVPVGRSYAQDILKAISH